MNPLSFTTSAVAASLLSIGGIQKLICTSCGTPVAELAGGYLILRDKHHGESHITVLNLIALAQGLKTL